MTSLKELVWKAEEAEEGGGNPGQGDGRRKYGRGDFDLLPESGKDKKNDTTKNTIETKKKKMQGMRRNSYAKEIRTKIYL